MQRLFGKSKSFLISTLNASQFLMNMFTGKIFALYAAGVNTQKRFELFIVTPIVGVCNCSMFCYYLCY